MSTDGLSPVRLIRGRLAVRLFTAVLLAAITAAAGAGLLGLSGWFLATCAVVGARGTGGFSWVHPSAAVRGLAIGRTGGRYLERLVAHSATLELVTRVRVALLAGAARLPVPALRRFRTGDLLSRVLADAAAVDLLVLRVVLPAVAAVTVTGGWLAVLMVTDRPLGAVVAAVVLASLAAALLAAGRGSARRGRALTETRGCAASETVAALRGLPELACFGAVPRARAQMRAALDGYDRARVAGEGRAAAATAVVAVGGAVAQVAVLAALLLPGGGPGSLATTVGTILLVVAAVEACEALPGAMVAAGEVRAATARLSVATAAQPATPAAQRTAGHGAVAPSVSVAVHDPRTSAGRLPDGLRLTVEPGAVAVVRGPSGTGKSTLLRVLAGEVDAPGADVRIDGRPAGNAQGDVLLVEHDEPLLTGTLADDLRLADPEATDEQLLDALTAVALTSPGAGTAALERDVGLHGTALSGGERRRVALARAVLARPRLLLLDEPTEGLDAATARAVLRGIRDRLPRATIVLVQHDRTADHFPWLLDLLTNVERGLPQEDQFRTRRIAGLSPSQANRPRSPRT